MQVKTINILFVGFKRTDVKRLTTNVCFAISTF